MQDNIIPLPAAAEVPTNIIETNPTIAQKIAEVAHKGQFRRDGVTPYIEHPRAVASRLPGFRAKEVAWLHDVIEDTEVSEENLRSLGLHEDVIDAVVAITKVKGVSYNDYLVGVKANALAREVKIADMLANLGDAPSPKQVEKYAKGLMFLAVD